MKPKIVYERLLRIDVREAQAGVAWTALDVRDWLAATLPEAIQRNVEEDYAFYQDAIYLRVSHVPTVGWFKHALGARIVERYPWEVL